MNPDNPVGKPAMLLQQKWAPLCRPISAAQGLQVGFSWHVRPENRRGNACAFKPLFVQCRCDAKVCGTGYVCGEHAWEG